MAAAREFDIILAGVCHNAAFEDPDGNVLMLHHRYVPREPSRSWLTTRSCAAAPSPPSTLSANNATWR